MNKMFIIGITGGTGSGKTTIVNEVINLFDASEICLLSSDSYYKNNASLDFNQRDKLNYDIPEAIDFDLLNKHIDLLKQEININVPNYCFTTHLRLEKTTVVEPKKILIIEGILILTNKTLRDSINYSVFLDCPRDVRFQRRLDRDIKERGRNYNDVINLFETRLDIMHSEFVEPHKKFCDLILNTNENININPLINVIKKNLR
ncbi:MAG: uridine kinase [Flavobacteriaceae bacterium]|nr:uridine kinase [Flavobacteriaceae bacterium]